MNDNAKKWVAALRSGEFEQTDGHLRDRRGYCCLGVACELYRREVGGSWEWVEDPVKGFLCLGEDLVMPDPVREWIGLRHESGSFPIPNGRDSLAARNDAGEPFEEIANLIETAPRRLFL